VIRRLAVLLVLVVLVVAPGSVAVPTAAPAATPRTTLPDIEDEVMCTQCGTPLNISEAPVADRERAFIRSLIAQGRTKAEIKTALKAEYGPRVLAVPSSGGFDIAAWLVPALLLLAGIGGVAYAAHRWRANRGAQDGQAGPAAGEPLDAEEARRLDAELAAFDR
jgi:cytochrome c-type biogenesis protein CcmH